MQFIKCSLFKSFSQDFFGANFVEVKFIHDKTQLFLVYCLIWTAVYIHVTTTSQDKERFQHLKVFLYTFVVDSLSRSSTTPCLLFCHFCLEKNFSSCE